MNEYAFPKSIGRCADKLYRLREQRLELQRQASKIEEEEKALKNHLINTLPKSQVSGVSGRVGRVSLSENEIPIIEDRCKFERYIKRTNRDYLAQTLKPSVSAIREIWDSGKEVPGVKKFKIISVSITKL